MNILCIGDLHIQKKNFTIFKTFETKIIEYIESIKEKLDLIVILGDVLHTMNIINTQCLNTAIDFFCVLNKFNIKIMVIVGNHDLIGPNEFLSKNHWMYVLNKFTHRNITIVDKVILYKNCIFCPYVPPGKFIEAIQTLKYNYKNAKYIFAHQEFKNAQYEFNNMYSDIGDEWDSSCKPIIISGHIHKKQWISDKIYYTGTPYQTRFNEDSDKTILYICNDEFIEIDLNIPKMITYKFNIDERIDIEKFDTNNMYKFIINSNSIHDTQQYLKSKYYKKLKEFGVIYFNYPTTNSSQDNIKYLPEKQLNFKQLLFDNIKQNENMKTLYYNIIHEPVLSNN